MEAAVFLEVAQARIQHTSKLTVAPLYFSRSYRPELSTAQAGRAGSRLEGLLDLGRLGRAQRREGVVQKVAGQRLLHPVVCVRRSKRVREDAGGLGIRKRKGRSGRSLSQGFSTQEYT